MINYQILLKFGIYQSDRPFTPSDYPILEKELKEFTHEWSAHSQSLKTSYDIKHDFFIILAVDESMNDASGCSIDSSVRVIKKLGEKLSIDFFKRDNLAFYDNQQVSIVPLNDLNQYINSAKVTRQSIFFNNLATSIGDLSSGWMTPAENTWLKRYFNI